MRIALGLVIALAVVGCKKQPKPEDEPAPSNEPPHTGHAKLHSHDDSGGAVAAAPSADAAQEDDTGGAGKPSYRDDSGHIHGPGGPVNMGAGAPCDAARNHCQRGKAWFSAAEIIKGREYRATPAFMFEGAWYDWRGEPIDKGGTLYATKPVGNDPLTPGTKVVFFGFENDDSKFADSEFDALTSSRWDAAIVESVEGVNVRLGGVDAPVTKDTLREITETQPY